MREYKAVVFDLDDTLYLEKNYVTSGFKVVSQFLAKRINIESEKILDTLLKLFEKDRKNVFNRVIEYYNVNSENIVAECVVLYRNHFPDINLTLETQELLEWIKDNGLKIGIITDGRPEGQWNKIKALRLVDYCDYIIVTDELGGEEFRKPSEIPYKKMLSNLDVDAKETIYVGDNPEKDFVSANKLGIVTVMLKNNMGIYKQNTYLKEYKAHFSINYLGEIKKLIKTKKSRFNKGR